MVCFVHFDFGMCFAPQRRPLFPHLNFQKWSEAGVLSTFWLRYVLRGTTGCIFSTSRLPKVFRTWCAFYILTWKCASHHNGVQFFISHLASWLRTRRFSDPTFRPSGASMKKNSVSRLSYLFAHLDLLSSETFAFLIFFLLLFSSLTLPTSAFHLSILSEVWLLNFLRLYTLFDKFILFFTIVLCFSKNVYLVLNKHERNFKLQILHVLKGVLSASHHADVHECFSKKNMSRLNMHVFKRWVNYNWI